MWEPCSDFTGPGDRPHRAPSHQWPHPGVPLARGPPAQKAAPMCQEWAHPPALTWELTCNGLPAVPEAPIYTRNMTAQRHADWSVQSTRTYPQGQADTRINMITTQLPGGEPAHNVKTAVCSPTRRGAAKGIRTWPDAPSLHGDLPLLMLAAHTSHLNGVSPRLDPGGQQAAPPLCTPGRTWTASATVCSPETGTTPS